MTVRIDNIENLSNINGGFSIIGSSDNTELAVVHYEFDKCVFKLPTELKDVVYRLCSSESILKLKDNWDGEGSERFLPETWLAVVRFLISYAEKIYSICRCCIDVPKIYPSAEGSIDIDWETDIYGLLINIDKCGKQATYYADNQSHQMTEGVFNPIDFNINLLPLTITCDEK